MENFIIILTVFFVLGIISFCAYRLKVLRQSCSVDVQGSDTERIVSAYRMNENYARGRSRLFLFSIFAVAAVSLIGFGFARYQHNQIAPSNVQEIVVSEKVSSDKEIEALKKEMATLRELVPADKEIKALKKENAELKKEMAELKSQVHSKSFFSEFEMRDIMMCFAFGALVIVAWMAVYAQVKNS